MSEDIAVLKVWTTSDYSFAALNKAENQQDMAKKCYYTEHDMSGSKGWTLVGEAEIKIKLHSMDQMVANKVDSIKKEIKIVQAEAELKVNHLKEQLSQLLAITNKPTTPTTVIDDEDGRE